MLKDIKKPKKAKREVKPKRTVKVVYPGDNTAEVVEFRILVWREEDVVEDVDEDVEEDVEIDVRYIEDSPYEVEENRFIADN